MAVLGVERQDVNAPKRTLQGAAIDAEHRCGPRSEETEHQNGSCGRCEHRNDLTQIRRTIRILGKSADEPENTESGEAPHEKQPPIAEQGHDGSRKEGGQPDEHQPVDGNVEDQDPAAASLSAGVSVA